MGDFEFRGLRLIQDVEILADVVALFSQERGELPINTIVAMSADDHDFVLEDLAVC